MAAIYHVGFQQFDILSADKAKSVTMHYHTNSWRYDVSYGDLTVSERPFVKRFALCYGTVVLSVCNVGILWPNGWIDQDETWHGCRPRPQPHCLR